MRELSFPAYATILCCLQVGCGVGVVHGTDPGPIDADDASTGDVTEAGSTGDVDDDGRVGPVGPAPTLPTAKGTCPTIADGMLTFGARSVRVWMDASAAAAEDGPLVFYWYGTGGEPSQAERAIDIERITSAGGIVVAPVHANAGTFPWLATGTTDFELADEVVACAEQDIGIDDRHIHSHGFSAGGLFSAQFSFARSNYLASAAMYSGGGSSNDAVDPDNKFAALVIYGGPEDQYMGLLNFETSSKEYADELKSGRQYVVMCNHGGKHSLPSTGEAASLSSAFFLAHGYGEASPWRATLPSDAPSYCMVY